MPLLRRREFRPVKPPKDLRPTEEVFLCRLTNEIFRDYDDFFKRTILCNSLVWSCSLTGRPSLTYQEALESEEKALKFISSFPVYLEPPVLLLVRMTQRGRLNDLCDDIFLFVKDRFFVGEIVDVVHKDTRETCRVNRVIVPPEHLPPEEIASESSDDEVIFIKADGIEEKMNTSHGDQKTPKRPLKPQMLKPSSYRYEVTSLQGSGTYVTSHKDISRKRGLFTREKSKLYIKHHCNVVNSVWTVKQQYVERFKLDSRSFGEFFAGPLPNFSSTPAKRNVHKVMDSEPEETSSDDDSDEDDGNEDSTDEDDDIPLMQMKKKAEASQKKKRKYNKTANKENRESKPKLSKEEKAALREQIRQRKLEERMKEKEKMAEERALARAKRIEELARLKEEQRIHREQEKIARREQIRKDMEESKERRRKEKEEERERQRAQFEKMKEYMKPRDDLECDDHKDIPEPVPVSGRIPQELFGGAVQVLEFLHAFSEELGVKEDFPDGPSLEMLEEALTSNKVDGALYDLVRFLLKALFRVQEEDEVEWREDLEEQGLEAPKVDLANTRLEEDPDPTYAAMTAAATAAMGWPVVHQGTELRKLPIEPSTVTEIVRLHFLASGARTGSEDSKWRYQQRGGYTCHDDPGLEFRMQETSILKTLTKGNLFDLTPEGKLKVMSALTNQLLTYVTMREVIEESYDSWTTSRRELRDLQRQEQRREKEEVTAKWRLKMEERLHEKIQRDQLEKERLEKLSQEGAAVENIGGSSSNVSTPETGSRPQSRAKGESPGDSMETDSPTPSMSLQEIEKKRKAIAEESAESKVEFYKQEGQLTKEIAEAIMKYSVTPLGEDRFFRRYWKFNSLPGLFVECDRTINEDVLDQMEQEVLASQRTKIESKKEEAGNSESKTDAASESQQSSEHNTSNSSNKENMDANVMANGPVVENGVDHDDAVPSDSVKQEDRNEVAMDVVNGEASPEVLPPSRHQWAFYNNPFQFDKLVESLNTRGFREAALREVLQQEKSKLVADLENMPVDLLTKPRSAEDDAEALDIKPVVRKQVEVKMTSGKKGLLSNRANGEEKLELMLREQILDIEDRLWQGALGFVKVDSRPAWVEAIEQGSYDRQCKDISWGPVWARSMLDDGDFLNMSVSDLPLPEDKPKSKDRLSSLKKNDNFQGSPSSTRCNTPDLDPLDTVVRDLACSLLQVSQSIDDKYLKEPLGKQEETKPMTRNRKKQEEEKEEEEEEEEKKPQKTCRECWEESLMACTSLSQIFLHLSTLERSVMWNKSILKARCRMCRRGCDPEKMLLCDGCNRGHHMFCLQPPLKKVPQGDWFCKDCAPKQIKRSPHKQRVMKKKQVVVEESSSSEEEEEEDSEEEEEEESDEEEEEESEEEEVEEEDEDDEMEVDADEDDEEEDDEEEEEEEEDSDDEVSVGVDSDEEEMDGNEIDHEDVCHKCRHGGNLVCCETCPKAFHMECCSPVLRKLPRGDWVCAVCKKGSKAAAIRVPTGKKGAGKAASKASQKQQDSPKTQLTKKGQEKATSSSRSQSRQSSRQGTPEPTQRNTKSRAPAAKEDSKGAKTSAKVDSKPSKTAAKEDKPSPAQEKKGRRAAQQPSPKETRGRVEEKKGRGAASTSSLDRRGQKRGRADRAPSTDSESSQEEGKRRRSAPPGASNKMEQNGSMTDDSASDCSSKNRRTSSGRGRSSLSEINKCEGLLKELIRHPEARPFLNAVSKRTAPDYYRIIKRPMDFAAMQTKVNDFQYSSPAELIADARLIFTNCQQYNRRSSPEYKSGLKMSAFLEKRIKELGIDVAAYELPTTTSVTSSPATPDQDVSSRKRSRQR